MPGCSSEKSRHARWIRRMGYLAAVLLASGCGGSTASPSPAALHAEVGDPVGDALADPSARVSPDLTHATVDVSNGSITVAVRFAPGAFDPASSRLTGTARDGSESIDGHSAGWRFRRGLHDRHAGVLQPGEHSQGRSERRLHEHRSLLRPGGYRAALRFWRRHDRDSAAIAPWKRGRTMHVQDCGVRIAAGRGVQLHR